MDKIIKTVITICDYGNIEGGAAKVAIESAIALASVVEESILFYSVGDTNKELESKGVKLISLHQQDILNNPNRIGAVIQGVWNSKAKKELKKLLMEKNSQNTIIHIHSWTKAISSSIFKIIENMGFKVVITIHDYFLACPNGGFFNYPKKKICKYAPLSLKCICTNCDSRSYTHKLWRIIRQLVQNNSIIKRNNISYIFISDFNKNILNKYINAKEIYRINKPIEINNRIKVEVEKNDIYLYIGRLTEEKGVRLFCDVISHLKLNGVVVGDGYLLQELKEKYPAIEFAGWQSYVGIRKYILKARCLIFPSLWYECSPLTIPEVQAFGIPCIVSDCCAGKDNIINGINGNIFNVYNKNDLNNVLKLYQDNKYVSKISKYVYDNFNESEFKSEYYVSNLISVYTKILKRNN